MVMKPGRKVQIETQSRTQVKAVLFDKVPSEVPAKYSDYSDIFLAKIAEELPKNIEINEYAIELEESK